MCALDAQLVPRREKRRTPTLIDATPSGRPELRRTALQGQRRPTSRGEIDATPAMRAKLRCTAPLNDTQLENKQETPRTDPGHLVIPATHRKRRSARRKTTHDFPA
ncbi:hypothetical protein NDU88_001285 [Pleurodeles waltl]|uniref:Uncharacterized protein n=1 Tax=Pleurodeles waltl TaxID=8319 RepID=A0AAV7SZ16_PLEWA|nr:hypothetical protein NDU88_001285 [Pleurodeles waltl]